MGTVGLNFGSPTSGAGFDVSSTVAQIVSNMQKVETPWQNQLTSLQNQDSVISNLGSLLSNLSNDISKLTDFEGILAQKAGSSSDNNVVELTSATSSAIAGTHTVVVNSLAKTSSGYLAELGSSSAKLSGSITFQVGSGASKSITIDQNHNTLSGLASAINSSGLGLTASVLTDANGSRLSLVSSTSGAGGNIVVTNNSLTAATANTLDATVTAGSGSTPSSALLSAVASSNETLGTTGALSVTVGSGVQQQIKMSDVQSAEGGTTLANLQKYIHDNSATLGFDASIVTNSDSTASLKLTSGTAGSSGTLAVSSSLSDSNTALAYASAISGSNASLTVDGVALTSASNTVNNLIPGVTFQILSTSSPGSEVQVVIANDNSSVESTVNQMVSDFNSLISAVNTQQGNDSSGHPEPLFGSPTLNLLQQELLGSLTTQNPNGTLDSISATAGVTLSGSTTIQVGSGPKITFQIGSGTSGNGTFYTGSNSNTLAGLADTINATTAGTLVAYTAGSSSDTGSLTMQNVSQLTGADPELTGHVTIQVGNSTTQTVDMSDVNALEGGTTLSDLAAYINDSSNSALGVTAHVTDNGYGTSTLSLSSGSLSGGALSIDSGLYIPGSGIKAAIVTINGRSTLTLNSQTSGSNGALLVDSKISAATPAALNYTKSTSLSGTVGSAATASDAIAGTLAIQVGGGSTQTIDMSAVTAAQGGSTLSDLQQYITNNSSTLGFTAALVNNSNGTQSLALSSNGTGSTGALAVTSNLFDTTNTTGSALAYNNSSQIGSLTTLGISLNNDGSMSFDANALDSLLNSDFSSVVGFFQSVDSWGQNFSKILTNAGSSSSTGILKLAQKANSSTEATLNAEITKEQSYISAQQARLTAELNQANEILQALPSQLDGMNQLYAAITGYNQKG